MQVNLFSFFKKYWICFVIFVLLHIITVNSFSEQVDCYDKSCYYVDTSLKTWKEAEILCNNQSGHLVTILDTFEQTFLEYRLRSLKGTFWIGLTDKFFNGELFWVDGQPLTFAKWNVKQPINGVDRLRNAYGSCISITTGPLSGFWQVEQCNTAYFSVCEVPRKLVEAKFEATIAPNGCGDTWKKFSTYCYKIFDSISLTWFEAETYCEDMGGYLVSYQSSEEERFVVNLNIYFAQEKWIGLTSYNSTELHHRWSDLTPLIYTNWVRGEPNNHNGIELCAVMANQEHTSDIGSGWFDRNCNIKKSFICKMHEGVVPRKVDPKTELIGDPRCPDANWKFNNGSCFIYFGEYHTWHKSREACRKNNSELVSIHSVEELEFVYQLLESANGERVWIGLNQLFSKEFMWSTGQQLTFSNWANGEPNDAYNGEKCATMASESGTWVDINCGFSSVSICRKEVDPAKPLPVISEPKEKCPFGWFDAEHRCYKIFWKPEHRRNWTGALNFCRNMGEEHDLASIQDAYEQDFLITLMKDYKLNMWIGKELHDLEYTWNYWTDNSDGTFTNWDFGQPRMQSYSSYRYPGGDYYPMRRFRRPPFGRRPFPFRRLQIFPPMSSPPFGPRPYDQRRSDALQYRYQRFRDTVLSREEDPDEDEQTGNCSMLRSFGHHAGKWSSHNCTDILAFICERSRGPQSTLEPYEDVIPSPEKVNCPYDYTSYGDACFKILLTPQTWDLAEAECKKESAELASISNVYESAFVRLLARKKNATAWIGLTNKKDKALFAWSDGRPILYNEWVSFSRYDEMVMSSYYCTIVDTKDGWNTGWKPVPCDQPYPFICKQSTVKPPSLPLPSIGDCPKDDQDWLDTGANCFSVKTTESTSMTWGSANAQCKIRGLELASFDNENEYNYVKNYANEISSDFYWIGLYKPVSGDYIWSDKSALTLEPWANNYPTNTTVSSTEINTRSMGCVVIDSMGKWRNIYCDHYLGYICKMSKNSTPSTKPPLTTTTDKPGKLTTSRGRKTTKTVPSLNNSSPGAVKINKEDNTSLSVGSIFGICIGVLLSIVVLSIGFLGYQKRHRLPSFMDNPRAFMHTLCHSSDDDIVGLPDNMEDPK